MPEDFISAYCLHCKRFLGALPAGLPEDFYFCGDACRQKHKEFEKVWG